MKTKATVVCDYLNTAIAAQRYRPSGLAQFRFEPSSLRSAFERAGVSPAVISELYGATGERVNRTMTLPFGIKVNVGPDGGASISSDLVDQFTELDIEDLSQHNQGIGAADGIEALVLALAAEGFDLESEPFARALATAVNSIGQNL